jgi:hypothetical protein
MKNWKSFLLLVLVFLAGIAVGVVGTRTVARHLVRRAIAEPERLQNFVERDLAWKLRLDKPQRVRLHEILTESRGQLRELRQQFQPQTAMVLSNANAQISALLTPEQSARFEDFKQSNALFPRPVAAHPPRPAPRK